MTLHIPDALLEAINLTEKDILLRLAIELYREEEISIGRASSLAQMHLIQFQQELAKRKIPMHYGIEDLERDIETLDRVLERPYGLAAGEFEVKDAFFDEMPKDWLDSFEGESL